VHAVSDGGTHRTGCICATRFRELQAIPAMAEGALLADVIAVARPLTW